MGVGVVFSIAKDALAAQRYGMDVTGHNIANANTPGYSRQEPILEARMPSPYAGLILGRGVDVTTIIRDSDQFIENRLLMQNSGLQSSKEMENAIKILEANFSENSETSLSTMLSDFWNRWHDISNNPSGTAERLSLYEHSIILSEQFKSLSSELTQMKTDLSNSMKAGISKINQITEQIAELNVDLLGMESINAANDLRDRRNAMVSELSEYIDVKTFEQENGNFNIITARGVNLVIANTSYDLELGGTNSDRVKWEGSSGDQTDITDYINNGKMGGWLDMRDEVIAKYELELDALAERLVWVVNQQHTQGVGLELFDAGSSITGTYQTSTDLGDLHFGDEIQFVANGLKLWIEDRTDPANPDIDDVSIDLSSLDGNSTLANLATAINNQIAGAGLAGVTADGSGTALTFTAGGNYAFGFSEDDSNLLAALGINTFFQGTGSGSIGINPVLNDMNYIAAAQIDASGNYAAGDNTNALAMTDLQYTTMDMSQWTCDRINGNTQGNITTTIEEYFHAMVGSMGIISSTIGNDLTFNEIMVKRLGELRDSISAVSLDEEMTNLMKYQHAYAAAAKLISVSDEMLNILINVKE